MNALRNPFVWVGLTATLVLVAIGALHFYGSASVSKTTSRDAGTRELQVADATDDLTAAAPRPHTSPKSAVVVRDASTGPSTDAMTVESWGRKKFREQAQEDADDLGDRYPDLERLWKVGRYGAGSKAALDSLQSLIDKYGDTHRADCARYLLARQRLLKGPGKVDERREAATQALSAMIDDKDDSRCETGARASSLSQLLLATQVYRHTDFDRSVDMLKDLAAAEPDEVDNVGISLALRARAILKEVEQQR